MRRRSVEPPRGCYRGGGGVRRPRTFAARSACPPMSMPAPQPAGWLRTDAAEGNRVTTPRAATPPAGARPRASPTSAKIATARLSSSIASSSRPARCRVSARLLRSAASRWRSPCAGAPGRAPRGRARRRGSRSPARRAGAREVVEGGDADAGVGAGRPDSSRLRSKCSPPAPSRPRMLCAWAAAVVVAVGLGQPQRLLAQTERPGVAARAGAHQAAVGLDPGGRARRAAAPPAGGSSAELPLARGARAREPSLCSIAGQAARAPSEQRRRRRPRAPRAYSPRSVWTSPSASCSRAGCGMAERQRRAVVLERLGAGREAAGPVARRRVGGGRLVGACPRAPGGGR